MQPRPRSNDLLVAHEVKPSFCPEQCESISLPNCFVQVYTQWNKRVLLHLFESILRLPRTLFLEPYAVFRLTCNILSPNMPFTQESTLSCLYKTWLLTPCQIVKYIQLWLGCPTMHPMMTDPWGQWHRNSQCGPPLQFQVLPYTPICLLGVRSCAVTYYIDFGTEIHAFGVPFLTLSLRHLSHHVRSSFIRHSSVPLFPSPLWYEVKLTFFWLHFIAICTINTILVL